jgi:hypothetical protein
LVALIVSFSAQIAFYTSNWYDNIQKQELISQNLGVQNLELLKDEIVKLDTIQNTQYDIRRKIDILRDMPKSAKLESIKITDTKMEAIFSSTKPNELKAYLAPFKPEALVISGDSISLILSVHSK